MADLTAGFVEKIEAMAAASNRFVQVGDYTYTNSMTWTRIDPPKVSPHSLSSLDGLTTYVREVADFGKDRVCFVVDKPMRVVVAGSLNSGAIRQCYATANLDAQGFDFGEFMPQEKFIIGLQTQFLPNASLDQLIKTVSSIASEDVRVSVDDGVSQEVTVKASLAKMDRATLPNRIELRPFRTFREVGQPASEFLLRAQKDSRGVNLALFEADGEAWVIEAKNNIREYLLRECPSVPVLV